MDEVATSYLSSRNINLMTAHTIMKETIFTLNQRNTDFTSQLAENFQMRFSEKKLKNTLQLIYCLDRRKNQVESSDLELLRYEIMPLSRLFEAPTLVPIKLTVTIGTKTISLTEVLEDVNVILYAEKLNKKLNECRSTQSAFAQLVSKSQAPCFKEFQLENWRKIRKFEKLETALNMIQISSVESERTFSAAGLFLTKLPCTVERGTPHFIAFAF